MTKQRPILFFVALCLCFALLLGLLFHLETSPAVHSANFSIVLYGESETRWRSLLQGLRQACNELGIGMARIILANENEPEQQAALLRREADNGAQGLLVAAVDSKALEDDVGRITQIPVIMVETGTDGYEPIGAPGREMGRALAEDVAADGHQSVVLLEDHLQRLSVRQRQEAFLERAVELGLKVHRVANAGTQEGGIGVDAMQLLYDGATALATLDNGTLETVVDAAGQLPENVSLYGIGASDKVVHAIDRGTLQAVCYQNEFNMGYISGMQLAQRLGFEVPQVPADIEFASVRKENLYDPEIERLVFPIIQ